VNKAVPVGVKGEQGTGRGPGDAWWVAVPPRARSSLTLCLLVNNYCNTLDLSTAFAKTMDKTVAPRLPATEVTR
jgi:hypothetical protein